MAEIALASHPWPSSLCSPPGLMIPAPHLHGLRVPRDALRRRTGGACVAALRGGGYDEWLPPAFKKLPLITRWLIAFQSIFFLLGNVVPDHPVLGANGGAVNSLGLNPVLMLQPFQRRQRVGDELAVLLLQSYRALTHVVVHASLPHLLFNMHSFSGVGERLERLIGSTGLLQLIVLIAIVKSVLLLCCEAIILSRSQQSRLFPGTLVGFSGVIFGLFTIDSLLAQPSAKVSLFGVVQVPARIMPVAMLGLQWILFPFASVWGHAAGIAAGALFSGGFLRWAKLPAVVAHDVEKRLCKFDGHLRGPRQGSEVLIVGTRVFEELWRSVKGCFTTSTLPIASHLQPPVHQRQHSLQYSAPERSRQLPTGGVFALRPEGFTDGGASGRSGAAGRKTSFMSWLPFKCKGPIVGGVRRVVGDKKDSVAKMAADAVERRKRLDTAEPSLPPPRSALPGIAPATENVHDPGVGIEEQRQSE